VNWEKTKLLILWEILVRIGVFPSNVLPAPSTVIATLIDLTRSGELFRHIGVTLYREEALILSDRTIVMRGNPGHIHREFTLDISRPRQRTDISFQLLP